jgi:catechol 2,3-dioxygenase-like lactoylglutathione lyase family enzyme
MMRPRRVLETALYCADARETARFYSRLLGLTAIFESDRLVALDGGEGTVLLLFRQGHTEDGLSTAGGFVPGHDGSGPVHLAFAIERGDVPAWEVHLEAVGVPVESRVTWTGGGTSLYFRDPDGHSVELATSGTWPTY